MTDLVVAAGTEVAVERKAIPAMSERAIGNVRQLETAARALQQVSIVTEHVIHGGMYARTVMVPAGTMITGALVKIPTMLIVHGDCVVYIGSGPMELTGYNVLPASAGRKQAFVARTDTWLTMIFPTSAAGVEVAEHQFTDEVELLSSHRDAEINRIIITGE